MLPRQRRSLLGLEDMVEGTTIIPAVAKRITEVETMTLRQHGDLKASNEVYGLVALSKLTRVVYSADLLNLTADAETTTSFPKTTLSDVLVRSSEFATTTALYNQFASATPYPCSD